ncbi:protein involved in gliding motility EpsA [Chryseobacterium piscicola]|jgi:polysaccharide export outer membrane protein|uniref:Gliding motility protein n=1 Tax=Chryseobacterium piscicola TaxID=551459 RepID=A0A1N7P720_9FLAO|nr:polysaccharide biosynthesis/export family protein [Chryseobacterium piscicola]PQA94250.1 gliding motility protein [Chryseobacterium piscicola]SIT06350.1 protein involved in gliding motility EpsA [Chryseobacterium piscicola]
MKNLNYYLILLSAFFLSSCISPKDVKYMQPSESLVINEEGLVPYNIPIYRVTKNDILKLDIITTPKGDAAQFYSTLYASGGAGANVSVAGGSGSGGNAMIYFTGLKVESKGDINIFGIGYVKAEGRTIEEISQEIQERVNENFQEGKSEVRLNTAGITYYVLGDVETTGMTGEKTVMKNVLTLSEAIAINGGLNRTIDRKNIEIHRKLPEGIKIAKVDLTRQDVMNSPYFYVQNGDEIYLTTRGRSLNGFGKDPVQTIISGVSVFTTALSVYLLIKNL